MSGMSDYPTEVTIRYAKGGLPDLSAAWAFVMAHLGSVGPDPTIEIHPVWTYGDDHNGERTFSAVVSGMIPEEQP